MTNRRFVAMMMEMRMCMYMCNVCVASELFLHFNTKAYRITRIQLFSAGRLSEVSRFYFCFDRRDESQ